jgi:glycosyltransferase involved in cell wall biosynthesis
MARILLVNKFYYPRGGDCTAVLTTEKLLKAHGHQVAVFCMRYPENSPSEWEGYFPSEISFSDPRLYGKIRAVMRLFRSPEVVAKFKRLLDDFRPDVVHLHNIHSYLSPVVAQIAHRRGIRVVWTMHDYKLICPAYSCLCNDVPCELCFRKKVCVVSRRCMKNSLPASLLGWLEAVYWHRSKLERVTDQFISPSRFLKEKMVSAGFGSEKIEVIHNFMYKPSPPLSGKEDYYCYVGRLSAEKGVATLLEAAAGLPYSLKIIGDGPLMAALRQKYPYPHIEFLGQLPSETLLPVVQRARLLVMPSVWYENNPYSVIEALCMGTPVLGAAIGGIPELIDNCINGFLFLPGNVVDMQDKINTAFRYFSDSYPFEKIAASAQNKFASETFYKKLIEVYQL